MNVSENLNRWQLNYHLFWCKRTLTFLLKQFAANFSPMTNYNISLPIIVVLFSSWSTLSNRTYIAFIAVEAIHNTSGNSAATRFGVK